MTKKEIIKKLEELGVEFDPDALKIELEALLEKQPKATEEPTPEKPKKGGLIRRKVTLEELKQLQVERRLCGYTPKTQIATFKEKE